VFSSLFSNDDESRKNHAAMGCSAFDYSVLVCHDSDLVELEKRTCPFSKLIIPGTQRANIKNPRCAVLCESFVDVCFNPFPLLQV
jgi:hypothetical protein